MQSLPPLREDLDLYPGAEGADGAPTWIIHDSAANLFFRISWMEQAILARWSLGDGEIIAAAVNDATTVHVTPQEVEALAERLARHHLLRLSGEALYTLHRQIKSQAPRGISWLLRNYLMMRLPLFRPDRFLKTIQPVTDLFFTRTFRWLAIVLTLLALYQVQRHWFSFAGELMAVLTLASLLPYAVALILSKSMHELGHAVVAHRYGCRVPVMGIALMVLWPVLYSDISEAWKLPKRRQRLMVGAGGIVAELLLAVLATLLWQLLPPGLGRESAFLLASTTWTITLLINLNPFMQFDGYHLLADAMELPNLRARSATWGRWWMRRTLFGWQDAHPEPLSVGRRRFMILFGSATWCYRVVLYTGIALAVYHWFFKSLGIVLMLAELWWLVVRPVVMEMLYVLRRLFLHTSDEFKGEAGRAPAGGPQSGGVRLRVLAIWLSMAVLMVMACWPRERLVDLPAVLKPVRHGVIHAPRAAEVVDLPVTVGQWVAEGDLLIQLSDAELTQKLKRLEHDIGILRWQIAAGGQAADLLDRRRILRGELAQRMSEHAALEDELAHLRVTAPFGGRVIVIDEGVDRGGWVVQRERIMRLADPGQYRIEAIASERDLVDLRPGAQAVFYPQNIDLDGPAGRVERVGSAPVTRLAEHYWSESHGGGVPVEMDTTSYSGQGGGGGEGAGQSSLKGGGASGSEALVVRGAHYRVMIQPDPAADVPHFMGLTGERVPPEGVTRGRVVIKGAVSRPISDFARAVLAVLIRESGF